MSIENEYTSINGFCKTKFYIDQNTVHDLSIKHIKEVFDIPIENDVFINDNGHLCTYRDTSSHYGDQEIFIRNASDEDIMVLKFIDQLGKKNYKKSIEK